MIGQADYYRDKGTFLDWEMAADTSGFSGVENHQPAKGERAIGKPCLW
jgi:hypothetical protein